ncbi:Phage attachment protein, partial [hydrothermal vent metagenome]
SGGDLLGSLTLKSSAGLALIVEEATMGGGLVSVTWNVPTGEQYFLVVGSADRTSLGIYSLAIAIADPSEDDGTGGGDGGGSGDGDGGSGGGGSGGGDDGGNGGGGSGDGDGDGGSGDGNGDGDGDQGAEEDEDPPVDATSDDSGAFTIVRTDADGRPILYLQEDDGSWTRVDLVGEAGGPTPEGRFSTFLDPVSGRSSIMSATASGLAVYASDEAGNWSVRNLSAELGVAPIATNPVTFTTRTGLVYSAGLDAEGNLIAYRQTGSLNGNGGAVWGFEDISAEDLAAQGLSLPTLVGSTLIAYVTGWNGLTIAGLDADGKIHAAWWSPGMERWTLADLSAITGAPQYSGKITAYLTPWNGINIAGTDVNGDLSVVWWVPSFGGEWRVSKLNQLLEGPKLMEGTVASWVTPWGGLNVSGLTAAGKVVVYWWTPSADGWQITTLSDYIPDVDPPARGVIGHTSNAGVISIMGLSEAGELVRYWWQPGESWAGEMLSAG